MIKNVDDIINFSVYNRMITSVDSLDFLLIFIATIALNLAIIKILLRF